MNEQSSTPQQIPSGWYPDGHGAMRWWNGVEWTEHVQQQAPQAQAAQPQPQAAQYTAAQYPAAQPVVPVRLERPRIDDTTPVDNAWVWVVSLAAFALTPALFLLDIRGYMFSIMTGEPSGIIAYFVWLIVVTLLGWGLLALCIVAAYRDYRRLMSLGVVRPFHWAFAFLGSTVYLIGRHVVLRKVLRTAGWPLWGHIIAFGIYLIVVCVWTVWLVQVVIGEAMYYDQVFGY